MADETPPNDGGAEPAAGDDDQAIRERVRVLTTQALRHGRLDPEGVKEIVRSVVGDDGDASEGDSTEARQAFVDGIKTLDGALKESADAAHEALQRLASRGQDFTDNDLKEALVGLKKLQEDYVAVTNRLAEATAGNLRDTLIDLTINAQNAGADAGARVATMLGEFADRLGTASKENATAGLQTARTVGVRMALLTSGILAGVGDALSSFAQSDKKDE